MDRRAAVARGRAGHRRLDDPGARVLRRGPPRRDGRHGRCRRDLDSRGDPGRRLHRFRRHRPRRCRKGGSVDGRRGRLHGGDRARRAGGRCRLPGADLGHARHRHGPRPAAAGAARRSAGGARVHHDRMPRPDRHERRGRQRGRQQPHRHRRASRRHLAVGRAGDAEVRHGRRGPGRSPGRRPGRRAQLPNPGPPRPRLQRGGHAVGPSGHTVGARSAHPHQPHARLHAPRRPRPSATPA